MLQLFVTEVVAQIGVQTGPVNVRTASAALISSCVYKLSAGKSCLESLENAGKSDAVVSAAGKTGSVTSNGADSNGTIGSMESSGGVKEVQMVRSSGSNPPSGDPNGGKTNGRRFLGTCISKISRAIICIHMAQNLVNKGFISWDSLHRVRTACSMKNEITIFSTSYKKDLLALVVICMREL